MSPHRFGHRPLGGGRARLTSSPSLVLGIILSLCVPAAAVAPPVATASASIAALPRFSAPAAVASAAAGVAVAAATSWCVAACRLRGGGGDAEAAAARAAREKARKRAQTRAKQRRPPPLQQTADNGPPDQPDQPDEPDRTDQQQRQQQQQQQQWQRQQQRQEQRQTQQYPPGCSTSASQKTPGFHAKVDRPSQAAGGYTQNPPVADQKQSDQCDRPNEPDATVAASGLVEEGGTEVSAAARRLAAAQVKTEAAIGQLQVCAPYDGTAMALALRAVYTAGWRQEQLDSSLDSCGGVLTRQLCGCNRRGGRCACVDVCGVSIGRPWRRWRGRSRRWWRRWSGRRVRRRLLPGVGVAATAWRRGGREHPGWICCIAGGPPCGTAAARACGRDSGGGRRTELMRQCGLPRPYL